MLSLALLTSSAEVASGIGELAGNSSLFRMTYLASPIPNIHEVMRQFRINELDVILIDLTSWDMVESIVSNVKQSSIAAVMIGIRREWNRLEQITFEDAGIRDLLREPFSHAELEAKAYEALHRERPVSNQNMVAFLPAKAGAGCSTVALHTAAAAATQLDKKVLVIEGDRRSGVMGIMLNQKNPTGVSEVLQMAGGLTPVEWVQHCVQVSGMDLLLANPARPGTLPTWADYYQLLRFVQSRYSFVVVDMPEIVNGATGEAVRSARCVCIICTPDIPSLMLATQRRAEIAAFDVPKENIHIILNRWEKGTLPMPDAEKILGQPVLATLPNDYRGLRKALLDSKLMPPESGFAKGCTNLVRQLIGLPVADSWQLKTSFLRHLGKIAE